MTCYKPADQPLRLLVGRHLPSCSGEDCHGCQPCEELHCQACQRVHDDHVCPTCLSLVRIDVHAITALAHALPGEATNGRPAFHTHQGVPGGDALVLNGPGRHTIRWQHSSPLAWPEEPHDPDPPLGLLVAWTLYWLKTFGQHLDGPLTLTATNTYLDTHLYDMSRHESFLLMSRELAHAVHRLEDVLHAGDRPDRSRVPCLECGTRLTKVWKEKPSDDHWLCPRCGEYYDAGRFDRAKHDHLHSIGANRYVSVVDATEAIGRPVQTVRSWIRRGLVDTARHPTTGRLVAWWPDVREVHLATQVRLGARHSSQSMVT